MHTQSIEGTWFRIKRWLPSSGRYNLSYYLPVYLWHCDCVRRGVNPFWDLLDIVSKAEGDKMFGLKTDNIEEQVKSCYGNIQFTKKKISRLYLSLQLLMSSFLAFSVAGSARAREDCTGI